MIKFVSLLCLALAICHSVSANVWTQNGEQASNSNPIFSDSDSYNFLNIYPGAQYAHNIDGQDMARQPAPTNPELVVGPASQPAQHKTNFGTKGINRLTQRNKPQQQVADQQVAAFSTYDTSPDQFVNSGYFETIHTNIGTVNATASKGKSKLRGWLPWNWVFLSPSNKEQTDKQTAQPQASAPKRSWSIFPSRSAVVVPTAAQPYCQCYPYYPTYPTYQFGNTYSAPEVVAQPVTGPNVHQVVPSDDHQGLASESIVKTLPAPVQSNANVQSHINLAIQQQQQQQVTNGQASFPSTGSNEQVSVQQQQVTQTQQVAYAPYQNSGSTYAGNNANSQTVPGTANFQSTTGDAVQNGQTSN